MLHELLFALYGCPGGIFIEIDGKITVSKCITTLHVSEVAILDKLSILGTDFLCFERFIREHDGLRSHSKGKVFGMYLRAFCSGLQNVLQAYRRDLTNLEGSVIKDPHISLFHIQSVLEKYFLLFPALKDIISEVKERQCHGCQILGLVSNQSGIPIVSEAFNKILQSCHKPLVNQLTGWMIYGQLLDPFEEFFIQKVKSRPLTDFERATVEKSRKNNPGDFEINTDLLPSYLSLEVATKILFVGSSVCLFGNNQQELSLKTSMFTEKEDYFSKSLYSLQEGEFSVNKFKSTVDEIRVCAAEHLWKIVVEEGNFLAHLYSLKNFYLLGRGELFLTFIDYAGHLLDIPPTETTEWEVNQAFRAAISAVIPEEEKLCDKFSLGVKLNSESNQLLRKELTSNGWSCLSMAYVVKWPLHTILNAKILEKYNKIFRFLLLVRQVQKDLHDCWLLKMKVKAAVYEQNCIWQILTNVTFLIDNLQYYLQNDVLESQFSILVEIVKSKKDFEAILHAHEYFLSSIISWSFLNWIPVYRVLLDIMSFCRQVSKHIAALATGTMKPQYNFDELTKEICRLTTLLFKNLTVAQRDQPHSNLGVLLLKLDYNKYFSMNGHLGVGNLN